MNPDTITNDQLKALLFYEYKQGVSCNETMKKLSSIFGTEQIKKTYCYQWFKKFESGNYNLSEPTKSKRSATFDDDDLVYLLNKDGSLTNRELAHRLNTTPHTIANRLRKLGIKRVREWVSRDEI